MRCRAPQLLVALAGILFVFGGEAGAREDGDGNRFTSATHGFRVDRPDSNWTFRETKDAATGALTVVVTPAGDPGHTQVTVWASPAGEVKDPKLLLDRSLARIQASPDQYGEPKTGRRDLAGRSWATLIVDMKGQTGGWYRVRQAYAIENGYGYILQCHAVREDYDKRVPELDAIWDTFAFEKITVDTSAERELAALAAKCGSEVAWASSWEEASRKAREEKRLIFAAARFYPGFSLTDEANVGPLMDLDVIELLRERFVPIRIRSHTDTPLGDRANYGLSPTTFGQAAFVLAPDGAVIRETFAMDASLFYEMLVDSLAARPGLVADGARPGSDDVHAKAEFHMRRGELGMAREILEGDESARAHRLRASLHRRERQGEASLDALASAREASAKDGGGVDLEELAIEEMRVLLRMGKFAAADAAATRFVEAHPKSPWRAEAIFHGGSAKYRTKDKDAAEAWWRRLVEDHAASRYACLAAAKLTGTMHSIGMDSRVRWPDATILATIERDLPRHRPGAEMPNAAGATRARSDALRYLLEHQRQDGSWICSTEVVASSDGEPHPFTQAITAICGRALLGCSDEEGAEVAIRAAAEYVRRSHEVMKSLPDVPVFMDYSPWSLAFMAWFLADAIDARKIDRDEYLPVITDLVGWLGKKQKSGGGWSYYVTGDLASGQVAPQSILFITAAVSLALTRAQEVGAEVPEAMAKRALDCLEGSRNENRTFEYMTMPGAKANSGRVTGREGAAGRGPVCSLALYRGGRGSLEEIRGALAMFVEYREKYIGETGKTLMHAGDGSQGSHYLMFDYAMAAEAAAALPEEEREAFREPLLETILTAKRPDGSFIDNPIIGPAYGAGMAFLAFGKLAPLPKARRGF